MVTDKELLEALRSGSLVEDLLNQFKAALDQAEVDYTLEQKAKADEWETRQKRKHAAALPMGLVNVIANHAEHGEVTSEDVSDILCSYIAAQGDDMLDAAKVVCDSNFVKCIGTMVVELIAQLKKLCTKYNVPWSEFVQTILPEAAKTVLSDLNEADVTLTLDESMLEPLLKKQTKPEAKKPYTLDVKQPTTVPNMLQTQNAWNPSAMNWSSPDKVLRDFIKMIT